mmetsp:Transcript_11144/g.25291  ORF Transcript_11144/g.25291 Transcript_11144/m.25291 type:complete len:1102 (+) Transcript_11144:92-3397(+)
MSDFPLGDAVPPPKEVKRAKSSSGRHKEDKHRDGTREHKEGRGDHHHKEGRERRDVLEGEGHREDKHRQGGEAKSRRDMESWLDVDLTQEGGDRNSEGTPSARDRIPKRPSSRADSRPKGPNSAQGLGGDQPRPPPPDARPVPPASGSSSQKPRSSSKHGSSKHAEKVSGTSEGKPHAPPQGEAVRPPAPAAEGAGVAAPAAPKESRRPKPRHAEPAPPEVHEEDIVPEAAHRRHPKAPSATRNGHAPPQNVPQVDDEHIEVQAHRPHHRQPEPVVDEEEIPEEYDDDFADDDDGEEYKPQPVKPVVPALAAQLPPETKPKPSVDGRVVVRPQSRGMEGPALSARSPSPGLSADPAAVARINEVLSRDKAKVQKAQAQTAAVTATKPSEGKGFLANYESTMPKFNLANSSLTEKVAYRRLQDLRKMNILSKRSVEKAVIFTQQPQSAHSLFLAGRTLKYQNVNSVHCQTGDDDQEIGVQTEDAVTEDKEDQFPVLTMGKTSAKAGGGTTQLLPFLRRTLPLFEAAMNEARSRAAQAYKADRAAILDASAPATCSAKCFLPKSFQENFIGQGLVVADVTLCPNWYGADHIVVLNSWPWRDRPVPSEGEALATFMRPIQSIIGLYALEGTQLLQEGASLRPARCLYSFCRLTSIAVVPGRAHIIIAGSETGSLFVWDLRMKAQAPGGGQEYVARAPDEDVAHFQGAVWLRPAFSTDTFAVTSTQRVERDDFLDGSMGHMDGGMPGSDEGLHLAEICCVRCSEGIEGDSLIFSLDSSGLVNFWRVLELASGGNTTVKLAPQGSCSVASPTRNLGHFADSTYLCIHPQQQAQFVVVSASGLAQTNRHNSNSIADGPSRLELSSGRTLADEVLDAEGMPIGGLSGFEAQPCSAAFNPFFPGLLLAAYADGELALFDSVLCVPLIHWSGAVSQVPSELVSVAWSPIRPSVFFVKSGPLVDAWDLSEKMFAPTLTVDLREHIRQSGGWQRSWCEAPDGSREVRASTCCELHATGRGELVASDGGVAVILRLPEQLTVPRQTVPLQHAKSGAGGLKDLRQIDDLVQAGSDRAAVLSRHVRQISFPPQCQLEVDILRRVLASASPLQAWT